MAGGPHEIDLFCGDQVRVEQECGDWFKGEVLEETGTKRSGIFPKSYIHLFAVKRTPVPVPTSPRGGSSSSSLPSAVSPTPIPSSSSSSTASTTTTSSSPSSSSSSPHPPLSSSPRKPLPVAPQKTPSSRGDRSESTSGHPTTPQKPLPQPSPRTATPQSKENPLTQSSSDVMMTMTMLRSGSMDASSSDGSNQQQSQPQQSQQQQQQRLAASTSRIATSGSMSRSGSVARETSGSLSTSGGGGGSGSGGLLSRSGSVARDPPAALSRKASMPADLLAAPTDPVIQELCSVLRDWSALMWMSYAEHNTFRFTELKDRLYTLRSWHVRILNQNLPANVREAIKGQVVDKIEKGKRAMKLDLMAKSKKGTILTDLNTPVVMLLSEYRAMKQEKKKRETESTLLANTIRRIQTRKATTQSGRQSGALDTMTEGSNALSSGLLFRLNACILGIGEPVQLAFQLWRKNEWVSDTFWVMLDAKLMPEFPKQSGEMGNIRSLFRDLTTADLYSGETWLVCRITRFGQVNLEKKGKTECRRPVGVAVLQLTKQTVKPGSLTDAVMEIYSCPSEALFGTLHEQLIASVDRGGLLVVPKTHPLKISLQAYPGLPGFDLFDAYKGLSAMACTERLFGGRGSRRMNRLLVTLVGCDGFTDKNVEVVVEALDGNGKEIATAFRLGEGCPARQEFRSWVMKHVDNPAWREIFIVDLDAVSPPTTTLCFTINHVTKLKITPIGCAVLNITTAEGTVLGNVTHVCQVMKPPKKKADLKAVSKTQAPSQAGGGPIDKSPRAAPMTISVATRLDSTELSQNASMFALLQWHTEVKHLKDTLARFMYADQAEIMRFLPETMGALFQILESQSDKVIEEATFHALVHVFNVLFDERSSGDAGDSAKGSLDQYAQNQFSCQNADQKLIEFLLKTLSDPLANKKVLVGTLKSVGYVLLFSYRSIELRQKKKPSFAAVEGSRSKLKEVFTHIFRLASTQNVMLMSAQATAIRSFASWTSHLALFFPPKDLAELCDAMLESIPESLDDKKQNLIGEKLNLTFQLITGVDTLFLQPEARPVFFKMAEKQIRKGLEHEDASQKRGARLLLLGLMESLQKKITDGIPSEALTLLPLAIRSWEQSHEEEAQVESATMILFFFYRTKGEQFAQLFESDTAFHRRCCAILEKMTIKPAYDSTWFGMIMFQHCAVLRFLELSVHLSSATFGKIVMTVIHLAMLVMSSDSLDLNSFSQSKKALIDEVYGDLRFRALAVLREAFKVLERSDAASASRKLVPYYLQLLLVNQADIKRVGSNYYWTAIKTEMTRKGTYSEVLNLTIDVLGQPRAVAQELGASLVTMLEKRFQQLPDLQEMGEALVLFVKEFQALLQSVHNLPPTPDYDIERTMATLSLLDYLASAKSSSYNAYAIPLLQQHLKSNLLAEAAAVLHQMASYLSWSDKEMLEPLDIVWGSHTPFPEESSRARKERMLRDVVSFLEKDSQYEKAIQILEEQQKQGETAASRERITSLQQKIVSEERLVAEYFRVGFYGAGFGPLSGTSLVFRGNLLERLDEFNARMLQQFPSAQLLTYTHAPSGEVYESQEQFLQIFRVMPSNEHEANGGRAPESKDVSINVRRFRRYNDCCYFLYERPVKKGKSGSEVADLWVEQTFFETDKKLPNIARFASVIHVSSREISPLELAVKTMSDKNRDLSDNIALYGGSNRPADAQPFISLVQGTVDAAVGGGFRVYQDVFFTLKYGSWDKTQADVLRTLIGDQIALMADALALWPKVCPPTFAPLLEHLLKQYETVKAAHEATK